MLLPDVAIHLHVTQDAFKVNYHPLNIFFATLFVQWDVTKTLEADS